jgi:hypothetical protein
MESPSLFRRLSRPALSSPYLRLTREGISLRAWPADVLSHVLPFRRYATRTIPWDCLVGVEVRDLAVMGLSFARGLAIRFIDGHANGQTAEIAIPSEAFVLSPARLARAITRHRDLALHFAAMHAVSKSRRAAQVCEPQKLQLADTARCRRRITIPDEFVSRWRPLIQRCDPAETDSGM